MKKIGVILFIAASAILGFSQGCSDAGFCTMGAMRPSQVYSRKINFKLKDLEFNQYRGKSLITPVIHVSTLDFTFGITEKTAFQFKLPYQWVNGNLGNTRGLGDISYSLTHNFYSSEKFNINATLGGKIPSNNGNIEKGAETKFTTEGSEQPLPMYYQTSLGTWDVVAGVALKSKNWMFATGVQVPIVHSNKNSFSYDEWANYPNPDYLRKNPLATDLRRGSDVMLRVERAFHFSNLDIRIGLLPIFRVTKDQIKTDGEYEKVDGTLGTALTATYGVAYHFNTYNTIKFLGGHKILARDKNPDGLTRHSVLSIAYVIRF